MLILITDSAGREISRKNCESFDDKTPLQKVIIRSSLALMWMSRDCRNCKISLVLSQGDIVFLKKLAKRIYGTIYDISDLVDLLNFIGKGYLETVIPVVYRKDTKFFSESMTVHNGKNGKKSRRYVAPALSAMRTN